MEQKGWGVWKDTRGTRLDETDVMAMVTQIKTTMPAAQQDEFDWGLTDSDQGNSEFKMMAFLWLKSDVSLWYQRHTLAFFFTDELKGRPVEPGRRLKPSFSGLRVKLPDWVVQESDIKWLTTRIRMSVRGSPQGQPATLVQLASKTIGSNWVVNEARFSTVVPNVDMELLQTILEDA